MSPPLAVTAFARYIVNMRPARPFLFDWKPPALMRPEDADDFVLLDEGEDSEVPPREEPPGGWMPRWRQPAPLLTKLRQLFLWKNLDELVPCPHCGSEATPRGVFVPEAPYLWDPRYYFCAECGGPLGWRYWVV